MNSYSLIIQDIYEKENQKHISLEAKNAQLAHKAGLKYTNSLREEIALIRDSKNSIVFTFRDGFVDPNE
jgi:hypothetical protein